VDPGPTRERPRRLTGALEVPAQQIRGRNHVRHGVADPQLSQAFTSRTRHARPPYAGAQVGNPTKNKELPALEERVRAYIRAVMVDEKLGLNEMAAKLGEDKGALSAMLRGARAPNLWVLYRLRVVFDVDPEAMLTKDPAPEFFRPGLPAVQRASHAPRRQQRQRPRRPSDASQADALAGKRHSS
jgi:transcriptional regulator with XRE-family HTH domain